MKLTKAHINQIIQEELTKMLNEKIQEKQLPVTYRIPGFISWLDSKDAELVGDNKVKWAHVTRPLASAFQMYKKEKFNL